MPHLHKPMADCIGQSQYSQYRYSKRHRTDVDIEVPHAHFSSCHYRRRAAAICSLQLAISIWRLTACIYIHARLSRETHDLMEPFTELPQDRPFWCYAGSNVHCAAASSSRRRLIVADVPVNLSKIVLNTQEKILTRHRSAHLAKVYHSTRAPFCHRLPLASGLLKIST